MKFVNFKIPEDREAVLTSIADYRIANRKRKSEENAPIPSATVKRWGHDVFRIRCNYVGGPTRDDGFVEGTFFIGKLKNTEKGCRMKGIILTEPVFHTLFFGVFIYLVIKAVEQSAIPVTPLCLLAFVLFMLRKEYKKQDVLYQYLIRAVKETIEMRQSGKL